MGRHRASPEVDAVIEAFHTANAIKAEAVTFERPWIDPGTHLLCRIVEGVR